MNNVTLLLGSNVGNRFTHLETALEMIRMEIGKITLRSSVYETEPWGNTKQDFFLNQVVVFESSLNAEKIMELIISMEKKMGRERAEKWGPRIIDIDILFFNEDIISTEQLTVPHPSLHHRKFTLIPLNEIMPGFTHPVFKKNISDLLNDLTDQLEVRKTTANLA